MTEEDFRDCKFVESVLYFYTFEDIKIHAKSFKKYYNRLTDNQKYLYRWYVYAHNIITDDAKNLYWDYLNGFITYKQFVGEYTNMKCNKRI